ncbi:MAG: NADPH-dependent F420 reductase [Methanobacteriaceae archaeon]
MKIAILGGTGDQGLGIALRLVKAGEDVIIGSRKADKAEDAVAELENLLNSKKLNNVRGMTNEDASVLADVIILTVPLGAQAPTLKGIKEFVKDKIIIDATVPINSNLGGSPTQYIELSEGSAAERTATFLAGTNASVVSAFNNISASSLMDADNEIDCDCLISGDNKDSKAVAKEIIEKIPGINVIDCGPLEKARIVEKITPLLIQLNILNKTHYAGLRITGLDR